MATRLLLLRLRATPNAAFYQVKASQSFTSATRRSRTLKTELKNEVALLALMMAAGVTGVHLYQNRESAPVKQVERLIKQAKQSAVEERNPIAITPQGDPKQALHLCKRAYTVIQDTNPYDRHLFELAFSIAAQYESLDTGVLASKYYLDALEHNSREQNVARRGRNRVVTLDRIAQLYENRGYATTAEMYFKEAISAYDQNKGRRELSKASNRAAADPQVLDQEIPGVLYNYSALLMTLKRWNEAENSLKRALILARVSALSDDYIKLIEDALANVQAKKVAEEAEVEEK